MRLRLVPLLFVLLLSRSGAAQTRTPAADTANPGRQLFISSCGVCHGIDGRGGEHAPNIATDPGAQALPSESLSEIIENGIPSKGMPSFKILGPASIQAVVAYLRVLQGKGSIASVPGDPDRGKSLFFGRAGCSKCHMIQGQGGFWGPDLSSYGLTHSPNEVSDAILNPNRNLPRTAEVVEAVSRSGQHWIGIARNEDNFSLQLQTPDGRFHLLMKSDLASLRRERQSPMPSGYGAKLTSREVDDIVSFLVKAAEQPERARVLGDGR
ncbi:MAG: c-type cytochrome [Terriglobia bacterium]